MVDFSMVMKGVGRRFGQRYSQLLHDRPAIFLLFIPSLIICMSVLILSWYPVTLSLDAESGFDTSTTDMSGSRLAWQQLSPSLAQGSRVGMRIREKRAWADDLLAAFTTPCFEQPIPGMDYLGQIVFEVSSFDQLMSLDALQELCSLHQALARPLEAFNSLTPYRNIWSIANSVSCLSPDFRLNCSFLADEDVRFARETIRYCWNWRSLIISCRLNGNCSSSIDHVPVNCSSSVDQVPANCSSSVDHLPVNCSSLALFELFYRILPKQLKSRPFHFNTFLPIFTLIGYRTQGYPVNQSVFERVDRAVQLFADNSRFFQLKGLLLDLKRDQFAPAALRDSRLALGAALAVFASVIVYSGSILYALAVALQLIMAVMMALSLYALVTSVFPLLNLVLFVLLLAVGCDDAFVLLSALREWRGELDADCLRSALAQTASTMALTSVTTALAFFSNLLSNVIVFRCFGLFAGLAMLANFVLVISWLPAFVVFSDRHLCQWSSGMVKDTGRMGRLMEHCMRDLLPHAVLTGRWVWLSTLSTVFCACLYLVIVGLHLPRYNPIQLFISSHRFEWFDSNTESLFEFVEHKVQVPMHLRLVWGIDKARHLNVFNPTRISQLQMNRDFRLVTVDDVQQLAKNISMLRQLSYIGHGERYWPERFLTWSHGLPCLTNSGKVCCNVSHVLFNAIHLDQCIRWSTSRLATGYNDTLIYDNATFELVGYAALLPSSLHYSPIFSQLSQRFESIDRDMNKLVGMTGWVTTEFALLSRWFDLMRSIVSDCSQSVLISVLTASILATCQLKALAAPAVLSIAVVVVISVGSVVGLGWELGVLEAVVLVLVVGFSFDFTLHYGVAVASIQGCAMHRVTAALRRSAIPVALAAVTSASAGLVMLAAETHPFHQVAVFLVVSTSASWICATFLFLPMLSLLLPSTGHCEQCVTR